MLDGNVCFNTGICATATQGKQEELTRADAKIAELEDQYRDGLITDNEKYQQTVEAWTEATENVSKMVEGVLDPYGSIYTIAKSGATKAKFQQIAASITNLRISQ